MQGNNSKPSPKPDNSGGTCVSVSPISPRYLNRINQTSPAEDDEEKHHLTAIHEKLHKTVLGTLEDEPRGSDESLAAPSVWITDFADFSAKYGLAYRLSSGHTGVHFNDSTKMVWEPITGRTEYYNRIKESVNGVVVAQDKRESFVMDSFPDALQKKVTLIKYFKSYLGRGRSAGRASGGSTNVEVHTGPFVNSAPALLSEPHMVSDMIYVKRWIQNPEAMILRLSNKVIQVAFNDRAEVLLSSESRVVTYTDPHGRRRTMLLSAVARESEEIAQRLRYTRDTLSRLISNREL
jgi:polo-like kinase 1